MNWTDIHEISFELAQMYPTADPTKVNFVDLMRWTMRLPGFDDETKRCSEKILEAIQQAWIEEVQ
jgi:FeS assembly protein IscX